MLYTNMSCSAKTFYGVEFKPGETKEVPGYINHPRMIVASNLPKEEVELPKQEKQKKSSNKSSVIQKCTPEVPLEDATTHEEDTKDSSSKSEVH